MERNEKKKETPVSLPSEQRKITLEAVGAPPLSARQLHQQAAPGQFAKEAVRGRLRNAQGSLQLTGRDNRFAVQHIERRPRVRGSPAKVHDLPLGVGEG